MFTAEQLDFARAIEQFCAENCGSAEQRSELTHGGTLSNSPELLLRLADLGWLGVSLPAEYGGGGAGMVEECIFLEETARGLAPIHAYGTGLTAAQTYLRHGTEVQGQSARALSTVLALQIGRTSRHPIRCRWSRN